MTVVFDHSHECSAWLRGIEANRLADIDATLAQRGAPFDSEPFVVVMPLSGRTAAPGSREDRECDRCGRYVPVGQNMYPIIAAPRPDVKLVGGLCGRCTSLEGVSVDE